MDIDLKISGLDGIEKALEKLPMRLQKRSLMNAVSYAVRPMSQAAKKGAPVGATGQLKRSIGTKKSSDFKKSGTVKVEIGARSGFEKRVGTVYVDPTKYVHLVEKGTAHSKAQPFLRRAFDSNHEKVKTRFAERLKQEIDKHVAQLNFKPK